jgi:hypothetical protein
MPAESKSEKFMSFEGLDDTLKEDDSGLDLDDDA